MGPKPTHIPVQTNSPISMIILLWSHLFQSCKGALLYHITTGAFGAYNTSTEIAT